MTSIVINCLLSSGSNDHIRGMFAVCLFGVAICSKGVWENNSKLPLCVIARRESPLKELFVNSFVFETVTTAELILTFKPGLHIVVKIPGKILRTCLCL